ncbi:MAG: septum formation initiator family protein [Deltaproteobacteria bacterium]|nr:MAG: septum formation initiator family protein [Deltaproteobacteria bacterium]
MHRLSFGEGDRPRKGGLHRMPPPALRGEAGTGLFRMPPDRRGTSPRETPIRREKLRHLPFDPRSGGRKGGGGRLRRLPPRHHEDPEDLTRSDRGLLLRRVPPGPPGSPETCRQVENRRRPVCPEHPVPALPRGGGHRTRPRLADASLAGIRSADQLRGESRSRDPDQHGGAVQGRGSPVVPAIRSRRQAIPLRGHGVPHVPRPPRGRDAGRGTFGERVSPGSGVRIPGGTLHTVPSRGHLGPGEEFPQTSAKRALNGDFPEAGSLRFRYYREREPGWQSTMRQMTAPSNHPTRRIRRLPLFIAAGLLLLALFISLFRDMGVVGTWRLRSTEKQLRSEVDALRRENADLKRQVDDLRSNPAVIEEEARRLGLVKDRERVIVVPNRQDARPPAQQKSGAQRP